EEATMAELAARYDVHPNLIANWKRKAREQVLSGFTGKQERHEASHEAEIKELRAKVGELVIERGFFVQGLRSLSHGRRVAMINPKHDRLSIRRQCRLVSIARSSFYYEGRGESPLNLRLLRLIDEQFLETPFYGSRQMRRWLRRQGYTVGRKRVRRLMRLLGLQAVFQRPRTSQPHPEHRIHPYLLRDLKITRPNHVWCSDVTYIPLKRGFLYLVAIMDWSSRKVLSWRLSNTLEASFCVEALEEALERYEAPEIFNTDQGSQFTSLDFTSVLKNAGIKISMDGKGRWMDNVFIERLWRSLKYECAYLSEFATGSEARAGIGWWMSFYNERRPHSSLDDRTPEEAHTDGGAAGRPGLCPASSQPEQEAA
ncbi:MAG: IS3 family transposase, partial [Thermoanaerobaculia bacterium]